MLKQVLVTDDDASVRQLVMEILEDDRYQLLEARDGVEALEIARERKPDLIFLDAAMPRKDGFQVFRELKAAPETAGIKVIMLTGLDIESAKSRGFKVDSGTTDYIMKPFGALALLKKAEDMLGLT